jgi:hypothetical protein
MKVIPHTMITNREGSLARRNTDKLLDSLDLEIHYGLFRYRSDYRKDNLAVPYSALLAIEEIVQKEPKMKYTYRVAYETFSCFVQVNRQMAYEYAKVAMVIPTYRKPAYEVIDALSGKKNQPQEIYHLSAVTSPMDIDQLPYPEILALDKRYSKQAGMHEHTIKQK